MSRSAAVLLVLAVLAVTVMTACGSDDSGGSSTSDKAAAPSAQTSTQATTPAAATSTATTPAAATSTATTPVAATPKNNAKVVAKCHAVLDPYVTMLHEIQDTVDGTPKFKTYNAAVGEIVDDYSNNFSAEKIPSPSCAKFVAQPVTGAYVKYFLATQSWTECRKRERCAAVMADLKKRWKEASTYLMSADKGFSSVTAR